MNATMTNYLHGKKVSDVFQDYMEPFLETLLLDNIAHGIHDVPSPASFDKIAIIPWCIWNAIIAETDRHNKIDFFVMLNHQIKHAPISAKNLISQLEARKRSEFSKYKYYFGKYNFYYNQNHEMRLKVEARMPDIAA